MFIASPTYHGSRVMCCLWPAHKFGALALPVAPFLLAGIACMPLLLLLGTFG